MQIKVVMQNQNRLLRSQRIIAINLNYFLNTKCNNKINILKVQVVPSASASFIIS